MLYLLDANVLITAHNTYYPIDRVPEFWDWLLHQGQQGRVAIPLEVFEEIEGVGNAQKDILYQWRQQQEVEDALVLKEAVTQAQVQHVLDVGYAPDLNDVDLERIGQDPFLIAYAAAHPGGRRVVTNEVSRPNSQRANRKIPDVCRQLGVMWCNTFELVQALDFRTGWRT